MECLAELDRFRRYLASNPDAYSLGVGPVEQVWKNYHDDKISIVEAIETARSPKSRGGTPFFQSIPVLIT
jgi:hypothetical protein